MPPTHRRRPSSPVDQIGRAIRVLAIAPILISLTACATKRDIRDLRDEIRELNAQNRALLLDLGQETAATGDSVGRLQSSLRDTRAETAGRLASIEDQLITVQELTGLSQQQVSSLRDDLSQSRAQAASGGADGFGGQGGDAGGAGAEELYDAAIQQYNRGSLAAARAGFEQIVSQYGAHELAPEARYFLADIRYREDDLQGAIDAFMAVREFHPSAERVPEALYRAGTIHLELGNRDLAREAFELVVNTWPDADVTPLARDELSRLQ